MTIAEVGEQVMAALRRAELLFAAPGDLPDLTAMRSTAEAGQTIAATSAGTSGAAATAHETFLADAVQRLGAAADSDARLGDQLGELATAHETAAAGARRLREGAEAVVRQQDSDADVLTSLRVLRAQVATMQRLVAEQSAGAADVAQALRAVGYDEGVLGTATRCDIVPPRWSPPY